MSISEQSLTAGAVPSAPKPKRITVDTVRSWHAQEESTHYNCGPNITQVGFIILECARLKRFDRSYRRSEERKRAAAGLSSFERIWYVDGSPCVSLEDAAERLNKPVEFTELETELLARIPSEFTPLRALRYHLAGMQSDEGGIYDAAFLLGRVTSCLHMLKAKGAVEYGRAPVPIEEAGPGRRTEPTIRRK